MNVQFGHQAVISDKISAKSSLVTHVFLVSRRVSRKNIPPLKNIWTSYALLLNPSPENGKYNSNKTNKINRFLYSHGPSKEIIYQRSKQEDHGKSREAAKILGSGGWVCPQNNYSSYTPKIWPLWKRTGRQLLLKESHEKFCFQFSVSDMEDGFLVLWNENWSFWS